MNNPSFTPGPWVANGRTGDGAKFSGTMHRVRGDDAWLAFVPTWENDPTEAAEAAANAHLIAAAPDLYAALEALFGLLDAGSLYEPQAYAARAALAKARGQV